MAGKKGLVDRNVLEGQDALSPFDFNDPIYHQERVAVGKDPHYFGDSQFQRLS